MPIADENRSTVEILKDARYHRAALSAEPEAQGLVGETEAEERALREAHAKTEAAEDARLVAHAMLSRADNDLDSACRLVELMTLHAVGKDRTAAPYRAAFPKGLTPLVALRGEAQAREVTSLLAALREQSPEIARTHAPALEAASAKAVETDRAYMEAERALSAAIQVERLARVSLLRRLLVNEGVLKMTFPGEHARVRSYFRPRARKVRVEAEENASDA